MVSPTRKEESSIVSDQLPGGSRIWGRLTLRLGDFSNSALNHVEVVLVLESTSLLGSASLGGKDAGRGGLASLALVEEGVVTTEEGGVVEGELCVVVVEGMMSEQLVSDFARMRDRKRRRDAPLRGDARTEEPKLRRAREATMTERIARDSGW